MSPGVCEASSPSVPRKEGRERVQAEGGRKPPIIWAELSLPLPWESSGSPRLLTWGEERRPTWGPEA